MIGVAKIALLVAGLSGGAFLVYDYISTKQENAVLDATLTSTTEAFRDYATDTQDEIDAWAQAADILSNKYQEARNDRDEQIRQINRADFTKMAERQPDMLIERINAATDLMFKNLEAITGNPKRSDASVSNETGSVDVGTGGMDSD